MKIVLVLALAACTDPSARVPSRAPTDAGSEETAAAAGAPTFAAVYRDVIVAERCTLGLCHGEGASGGGLDLDPKETAYDALVGAPATGNECADLGLARVEPGAPERSLLVAKLSPEPPCGFLMPPDGPVPVERLSQIETWIARGAPND